MKRLVLGPAFTIPAEAVTQTFALLAVRRAGKSNAAAVLAEELFAAKLPFVVIDPKGDWYGLRSSGDGQGPGLPIPIFGGDHADVPLERGGGAFLADLIIEQRLAAILDVSELSEGDKTRFLIDFAERLYKRNREPLHVILEEADDYIPQRPFREQARCVGAFQRLVKRGGFRGLGVTLISQRSAAVNKDVLTQTETLIVLRTTAPQDRKAIEGWLEHQGQSREILASLAGLENGEAWVSSPHFLRLTIPKRVRFRRRATFDSGATPTATARRRDPATLADVDLGAIRTRMAETIERAKAEDPRELRRQLAEARVDLARAQAATPAPAPVRVKTVEVPVFPEAQLRRLEAEGTRAIQHGERLIAHGRAVLEAAARVQAPPAPIGPPVSPATTPPGPARSAPAPRGRMTPVAPAEGGELTRMTRAMLTTLAQHPTGLTKGQVLIYTGYRSSGPVSTAFAEITRAGWVTSDGARLLVTAEGLRVLGPFEPLPTGAALREHLLRTEGPMIAAFLRVLFEVYPNAIRKGELLERTGYKSSGPVSSAFGKLVKLGWAVGRRGELRAAEEFFA
jgi:hypothetical protein